MVGVCNGETTRMEEKTNIYYAHIFSVKQKHTIKGRAHIIMRFYPLKWLMFIIMTEERDGHSMIFMVRKEF